MLIKVDQLALRPLFKGCAPPVMEQALFALGSHHASRETFGPFFFSVFGSVAVREIQ
jgi:hypothetical protein